MAGGNLTITTEPGDIYTGDTNPPPNNFILQSRRSRRRGLGDRDQAVGSTINGGYAQGGLIAYVDGDNYVKLDAISDAGQTRINRLELRSEVAGVIQTPPPADPHVAGRHGTTFWLRLTKAGNNLHGRVLVRRHDLDAGGAPRRTR